MVDTDSETETEEGLQEEMNMHVVAVAGEKN